MATIIKSVPKEESWAWRNGDFVDAAAVRCVNHQFKDKNRSFVNGEIDPYEDHGWTTAASDYYYFIISGSGTFYVGEYGDTNAKEVTEVKTGNCFEVPAGTVYNYRAGTHGLKFVLFMNNLWDE